MLVAMSFMMKPIIPTNAVPRKQIFIESQSSLLPGFVARCSNLLAEARNDLILLMLYSLANSTLESTIKRYFKLDHEHANDNYAFFKMEFTSLHSLRKQLLIWTEAHFRITGQ